jgi:DNA-nicking Smr family endonuclease
MKQKPPKTKLSEDDYQLFLEAMADTRPLPLKQNRHIQRPEKKPLPGKGKKIQQQDLLDHADDIAELKTNEQLAFLRPGLNKQVLRQLRRGNYRIEDEIDLHGLTQQHAEDQMLGFIDHAVHDQLKYIRIIHGKGLRSNGSGAVLKTLCNHLLRRHPAVMAFVSAKPADGGGGALCVLLKTSTGIESNDRSHQI